MERRVPEMMGECVNEWIEPGGRSNSIWLEMSSTEWSMEGNLGREQREQFECTYWEGGEGCEGEMTTRWNMMKGGKGTGTLCPTRLWEIDETTEMMKGVKYRWMRMNPVDGEEVRDNREKGRGGFARPLYDSWLVMKCMRWNTHEGERSTRDGREGEKGKGRVTRWSY